MIFQLRILNISNKLTNCIFSRGGRWARAVADARSWTCSESGCYRRLGRRGRRRRILGQFLSPLSRVECWFEEIRSITWLELIFCPPDSMLSFHAAAHTISSAAIPKLLGEEGRQGKEVFEGRRQLFRHRQVREGLRGHDRGGRVLGHGHNWCEGISRVRLTTKQIKEY